MRNLDADFHDEHGVFKQEYDFSFEPDSNGGKKKNNGGGVFKNKKIVTIAIVIVAIFGFLVFRGAQEESSNKNGTAAQPSESSSVEGSTQGVNVSESVGEAHVGSEDANNSNGTGAILAFDYAYYNDRDGEKVLEYFDPDNQDYDAEYVQRYIDRTSSSTKYELSITPEIIGERYSVVLTLSIPGYEPVKYNQDFLTVEKDGKYFVKELSSRLADDN